MSVALWLLAIQGLIGAFDTLYYHEWRARLPAQGKRAASELKLHAARDFFYAVLFGSLPVMAWHGRWVIVLAAVLIAEILLTMTDFVVEASVRKPLGDVYPGERVTHAVMGILYGAMIAFLLPELVRWWSMPTALVPVSPDVPSLVQWSLVIMAVGVLLSGARDLYAAYGGPGGNWPWRSLPRAHDIS
jgi:phosphatidylglycerophosphate synthase